MNETSHLLRANTLVENNSEGWLKVIQANPSYKIFVKMKSLSLF